MGILDTSLIDDWINNTEMFAQLKVQRKLVQLRLNLDLVDCNVIIASRILSSGAFRVATNWNPPTSSDYHFFEKLFNFSTLTFPILNFQNSFD